MNKKYYNLTDSQKSIWLTEQYYKNTNINNVCGAFYSTQKLDFELLKKSLNIFLKNNDSFKIKLDFIDGEPKQYFCEMDDIDFEIVDIKNKDEQIALEEKLSSKVFNILNSFLFEIVLFRYPDGHGGFVINSHHIISDSWTNGIVVNDVALIYAKLKNNEEYTKDSTLSYKTYIESDLEYVNSIKFEKDKKYWNEVFSTVPELATVPSIKDTSRSQDTVEANRLLVNIDENLLNPLKAYCEKNKVSLYNFFMTVFSLYLGRVSGLDEFVIGTPILNRSNFREKQTTGMFINTLPLKIHLMHEKTFLENLKDIAISSMSLLRHQKYSFQHIIEDLRKKDSNLPKIYNVLFSYQITKMNENEDALKHTASWTFNKTITDDLNLHMFEWNENNSIQIAYDYKLNMYDEQDIKDIHARILHIIHQIIENETILLKDIEIVTPEEKYQLLYEFNNTKGDYPKNKTIVDLFEEQVEKTPDNIAVVFEDQTLTYRELNEKANQLARYLIKQNVKNTNNIGIFTNRSIETIVGILSILKLGKTFVPIDPLYPENRIKHMINSSNLSYILSDTKILDIYNENLKYIYIDFNKCIKYSCHNLNINSSADNNLYIIYTSGSTGTPKGVSISHKNIINLVYFELTNTPILEKNSNILQFATMSFDVSYQEIFSALLSGNTLVLISDEKRKNIDHLISYIVLHKISTLFIPPAYLQLIVENNKNIKSLAKTVKYIITAGESLLITKGIHELLKFKINLFNHYGPAETHVATTYKVDNNLNTLSAPIGTPISNAKVYIVDNYYNLCPPNVVGQIAISGDCVGNGYIDKSLNKNKFINNPFDNTSSLYLTGDLGFINHNNTLEFIGRKDFQVKINGFRIELDEINQALSSYTSINSCATVIHELNNKKYIFSYYTSNSKLDNSSIISYLKEKLPKYMIPNQLIQLDRLPINNNGKIDKKALPTVNLGINEDFVKPTTQTQKKLSKIWKSILNLDKISIMSDFFNIGGDSLLAIKLSSYIKNDFNIDININDIFNHSTIYQLSLLLDSKSIDLPNNLIKPSEKKDYYPLSSAQKRIYYSSSLDKDSTLYNIAGGIILDKLLDFSKLESCFKTLINRHDSLRTHFEIKNNDIVQIVNDNVYFNLENSKTSNEDLDKIYFDFVKPFDLSKAPLFRAKVVELKDNKMLLLLDMHHIISDGTSLSILLQELCDLYNGYSLHEKNLDYKDFTLWEKQEFKTKEFKNSKEYWLNEFKDEIPLLNMPTTYPRPSTQSFEGCNYHAKLSNKIFEKINEVAKILNITPYMLLLSVYYILLSKYTSQDDIVVGTPIVGRDLPELSNMLGMFVNTLPLRNKIDHSLSFVEFCNFIKENCLNSFKNQNYPFDELVKALDIKRDTSRNPLFDIMFVYQNNGYPAISFKDTPVKYFIPDNNVSKFDLTLEIIPINNEYDLRFEYCTKLFNEDFIKQFASHYINILNIVLENNNVKIADIDMLSNDEKHQILYEFNDTKVAYPKNKTVIELFEKQVEKTPNQIAVVFENQKLTYKELNEKSNQLAHFLLANNANIGDMICILLDKSLEMIVSILGVLKVGATFLPIDVNYPNERIDYIIKDSKSNILLTTQNLINKANDTVQVLNVELDNIQYNQYSKENIGIKYSSENLAYVMYTSGSTGNPKGVMVTHKNILRLVINNKFISFSKNENILQTGSIVFDACTFEIWGALLNGFKLYIIEKKLLLDAAYLKKYIKDNQITSLFITTQLFNQLVDSDIEIFNPISNVLTGGEAVSVNHMNKLNLYNKSINIIHCYGPTENTTFSTCYDVEKTKYKYTIPIGKPISNSTAYVVSNTGTLCPIGVPGELWVGGDGVAKGYLNNETLTNEKFVPNPFGDGIIYKTGDLVKWLPDGNIEFIGRIDNQVKVRGFRIELNEIDLKILEFPNIKYSITILNNINNEKVICSYFVANSTIDLTKLKEFLKNSLPNYMIPTYMLQLENFKMNINGKIDKKLLPTDFRVLKKTRIIRKPNNEVEENLLKIYKTVTNLDEISVTDNLFDDLHGDSLTAMKIQVEALSQGINIPYSDIFKYPSIKQLANNLINQESGKKSNNQSSLEDLKKYDTILEKNSLDYPLEIMNTPISNVLLTGFTGFLGAHILDSFMKKETGNIYCLIRNKNNMSAQERLLNVLHFYFEDKYDQFIGKRIHVVEGDISLDKFGLSDKNYKELGKNISTVIHSAALVKHYGMYQEFESTNIIGTKNIVEFAKQYDLTLLHISTLSVSGNNFADGAHVENDFETDVDYAENNFYIGQNVEGLYAKSKFEAEHIVLEGIYSDGLKASILRMGNLTSRFSEGKFQQNHFENAFVNRFKSFLQIGYVPDYMLKLYAEFTPIDFCGDAIIEIAKHFNPNYTVFHLMNEKRVYLDRLFEMMKQLNININIVPEKEFIKIINDLLADETKKMYIEGIINDFDKSNKHLVYESKVKVKCDFSKAFLKELGFEWPYIDINYIRNYFKYLENIGYLNIHTN